jgi:hypothetical protein
MAYASMQCSFYAFKYRLLPAVTEHQNQESQNRNGINIYFHAHFCIYSVETRW